MATEGKNLSHYDKDSIPDGSDFTIGIVVSEWNDEITGALLKGAVETLKKHGVQENKLHVKWVPGSFELPLASQWLIQQHSPHAVIALGSVIQGETKHFDFVCEACALGIKDVSLSENTPIIFGVLTDNTHEQAVARSGGKHGNKGIECAIAALKMAALRRNLWV
ncbi:6,7-dimethyl-8-ribityllumazine synthase [Luteibaculum oceani]|uniref:6,7-dimethyl-8-ribityllumazine synthase n=1 Tax=Luteibaculum oceani TaxID=1294296 RepID=A0A5C6US69_9FLAO|nr:6,7-dimethyl-8-ribityllumazine synthase [Luteibaculum oceani]TXC76173.1 6,7-dimethyl-8-ribityllumazine synthase [Luteibaculum oceani]